MKTTPAADAAPERDDGSRNAELPMIVAYWIATAVLLFLLGWAALSYHFIHETQAGYFKNFGYPTYLVYPLAYLKMLAMMIIVTHRYNDLRDMAYAAYFLNMIMALAGHVHYGDFYGHAVVGAIALPVSYLLGNQVRGRPKRNFFGYWTVPR